MSASHYRQKADAHKSWSIIWGLLAAVLTAYAIGSMSLWSFIIGAVAIVSLLLCISQAKKHSWAEDRWLLHVCRNHQL